MYHLYQDLYYTFSDVDIMTQWSFFGNTYKILWKIYKIIRKMNDEFVFRLLSVRILVVSFLMIYIICFR
jgi:hypothetical protein